MSIRGWVIAGVAFSLVGAAWAAGETRYQQLCRKAQGSHGAVRVQSATYFGSADPEELLAAGFMADGSVLVAGNAWGPGFPAAAHAQRIGADQYVAGSPYLPESRKKGKSPAPDPEPRLNPDDPNLSGFLVRFSPTLNRVLGSIRFGWGNATITHATFAADGATLVSGKCSVAFETWLENGKQVVHTVPAPGGSGGGADLYLARILPGAKGLDWVVLLPGAERSVLAAEGAVGGRAGVRAYSRGNGEVEFAAYGRLWIRDDHGVHELGRHQGGVLLAVDPKDGTAYMGGEESTRALLKSWRRPFLCRYDRSGQLTWQLWRWGSKQTAHDRKHLESDAGVRGLLLRPDGCMIVHGQSVADNLVFSRQLTDPDAPFPYDGFLDLTPGGGSASVAHLLMLRPDAQQLTAATCWSAYSPDKDQPAGATIAGATLLPGNSIAVVGSAENALIESPDAWVRALPGGGSGCYLSIFSPDFRALRFSSLLSGTRGPLGVAARGDRLVVVGNAAVKPARARSPWPAGGFQPKPAGAQDGLVLLVKTSN